MNGVGRYSGGEAVAVAKIRRGKRYINVVEALEIRQRNIAEMFYADNLSIPSIATVTGLSTRHVRRDLRAAERRAKAQGQDRRRLQACPE